MAHQYFQCLLYDFRCAPPQKKSLEPLSNRGCLITLYMTSANIFNYTTIELEYLYFVIKSVSLKLSISYIKSSTLYNNLLCVIYPVVQSMQHVPLLLILYFHANRFNLHRKIPLYIWISLRRRANQEASCFLISSYSLQL